MPVSSVSSSTCGVTRSRKGILLTIDIRYLHFLVDITQNSCRIPGHDCIVRNIPCDDTARADNGVLADADVTENRSAGAYAGSFANYRSLDLPVRLGLQTSICG